MKLIVALVLFGFFIITVQSHPEASPILGAWKNQRGSIATITAVNGLAFTGWYASAVGNVTGKYVMWGLYDPSTTIISWNVNWSNENSHLHSMTGWIGQYFPENAQHIDRIDTNWLLTTQVADSRAFWQGTRVGSDTFHRA